GAAMKLAGLCEKKRKRTRKAAAPSAQESMLLEQYRRGLAADVYVDWLVRMIGGWLEPGHGNLVSFLYAAQHLPVTGAAVEVGSFLGASTNILAYLLHRHAGRRPLFNCDSWCFQGTAEPIGGGFAAPSPPRRAGGE